VSAGGDEKREVVLLVEEPGITAEMEMGRDGAQQQRRDQGEPDRQHGESVTLLRAITGGDHRHLEITQGLV